MTISVLQENRMPPKRSVVAYKKNQKARKVLAYLYQEGACTLAQLAETLHTSIPSVTDVVEQLVDEGWINTMGTASGNNGRRPVLFSLNPVGHYVVVLDSNTHETSLLIVNLLREVIYQRSVDITLKNSAEFSDFWVTSVREALAASGIARSDVMGVGLTLPGLIDFRRGLNLTYPSLSEPGQSLTDWLEHQLKLPVFLINDTKATALGEHRFGSGQGKKHALSINIDWGVGLGIIINGEVFQGASGFSGELGHIQVKPDGELCSCGKIGCLDTLVSASALVRKVQQAVQAGQSTRLAAHRDAVNQLTINHIIEAAKQGDAFAIDTLHEMGFQLGKGLAIAVMLFNPEIIIIDGVLAQASGFITGSIQQALNRYCLTGFYNELTVEATQLDGAAKWLGTHAYVMENLLAVS